MNLSDFQVDNRINFLGTQGGDVHIGALYRQGPNRWYAQVRIFTKRFITKYDGLWGPLDILEESMRKLVSTASGWERGI